MAQTPPKSEIEHVLARKRLRPYHTNGKSEVAYLVRWSGSKPDSWESLTFLRNSKTKALKRFYDWANQEGVIGKYSIARPEAKTSPLLSDGSSFFTIKYIGDSYNIVTQDNMANRGQKKGKNNKTINSDEITGSNIIAKPQKNKSKSTVLGKAKNVKSVNKVKAKTVCNKAHKVMQKRSRETKPVAAKSATQTKAGRSMLKQNTDNAMQKQLKNKPNTRRQGHKTTGKKLVVVMGKKNQSEKKNANNKRLQEVRDIDEISQSSGSESDTLYSLNELSVPAKRLKLELVDVNASPETSCVTTPELDSEISFKLNTPAKKMLLKDSMKKKKPIKGKQGTFPSGSSAAMALPATPSSLINNSSYKQDKTPPGTPSRSSTETTPTKIEDFLPSIPVMPLIHNSPAACYKNLMKNLQNLQADRGMKKKQVDDTEPVERRTSVRQSESVYKYKEIVVKKCSGYTQIWLFTQTKMKNSFNPQVFSELIQALQNAKFDDSRLVMLSGSGSVFCSGIDLDFICSGDYKKNAKKMADSLKEFIGALISFPKPLVAAVNGLAVGLGTAILPLCDIVYASDKASFHCPYTRLSQTPEGCSSYTFPQVMGVAMANEMLLGGRKITATEAYQVGLVSQVFWPDAMMQLVIPRIEQMAQYSAKALEASKLLIRSHQKAKLEFTCDSECQVLADRWSSAECLKSFGTFLDIEQDFFK